MSQSVLLIEDTPTLQMIYATTLRRAGYQVECAVSGAEARAKFRAYQPHVVILDMVLPDTSSIDIIKDCLDTYPNANFIAVTASDDINRAVSAMRAGAYNFIVKPFSDEQMLSVVDCARRASRSDIIAEQSFADDGPLRDFIGSSPAMQRVYRQILSTGQSMATAFITGEIGTGKRLCARAIHDASARSDKPFIALNCAEIAPDQMRSEVFGHLKNSFPGALAQKTGAIAAADSGTLFLNQIESLDLQLQSQLLRFLRNSTIEPLGAIRQMRVNVRLICASNRDPLAEVQAGRLLPDLYDMLNVVPIHMPALRHREDDVIEIAHYLLARISAEEGRRFAGIDAEAEELLRTHHWPGNIDQLISILRDAVVLNDAVLLSVDMLPSNLRNLGGGDLPVGQSDPMGLIGKTLAEIERWAIEETISRSEGSIPKAARILGVAPSTLYRKRAARHGGDTASDVMKVR